MVARNFTCQETPYSRLLQVPDEDREFLNLEELKPHQLTELGLQHHQNHHLSESETSPSSEHAIQTHSSQEYCAHPSNNQIYYDMNRQSNCDSCLLYMGEMTQTAHNPEPIHITTTSTANTIDGQKDQTQNMQPPAHSPTCIGSSRKRKSFYTDGSDFDDETSDDSKSVRTTDDNKKQNHSEIEKRRRDKMNTYITELSAMIPMCNSMSRKLDKLTVLRMAVQHLKSIRGAVHSYTEGHYKPSFLSDQELKMLILQAAEGFLFVVGCDRGRLLYVSESVSQVLNYSQGDLLGQSWFDILHPKDVAKVKEQLSSSDLSPRERLIDAKTMLPVKTDEPHGLSRLCPGARRSFFCRMKRKLPPQVKEECESSTSSMAGAGNNVGGGGNSADCHRQRRKHITSSDKKYCVIQCTGYLKSWAPAKIGLEEQESDGDGDSCNLSCLVAIGRTPPDIFEPSIVPSNNGFLNVRSIQFMSRHAIDGKFLFVDQRATLVLGFLPQELLGTSMYEYYYNEDVPAMAESHKEVLQSTLKITTPVYRFRTKDKGFVRLQSDWKSFKNPWTKDIEYLIAKNSVILNEMPESSTSSGNMSSYRVDGSPHIPNSFDFFNQANGRDMHRLINTHVEASKIGRKIADQILDFQRRLGDSSSENSPHPSEEQMPSSSMQHLSSADNSTSGVDMPNSRYITSPHLQNRINSTVNDFNNISNSMVHSPDHAGSDSEIVRLMGNSAIPETPIPVATTSQVDGNDEAAMAVIMSLLEADAGLGGPVDFTGLPWPLP